jgi:hypothetical protein
MNAPYWAAIVFVVHVLGLVMYLVARRGALSPRQRVG